MMNLLKPDGQVRFVILSGIQLKYKKYFFFLPPFSDIASYYRKTLL